MTTVFDVSQTDGEPLPTIEAKELEGDVIIYEDFMKGLEELSPVPFQFMEIEGGAKGYYSKKYIAIQKGMSNAQTMKTAVHETAHAILHDRVHGRKRTYKRPNDKRGRSGKRSICCM